MTSKVHVRRRHELLAQVVPDTPPLEEFEELWRVATPEERRELDLLILADPAPKRRSQSSKE